MSRWIATAALLLVVVSIWTSSFAAQSSPSTKAQPPLDRATLLALVAGGALPGTIVDHIRADGLAFRPDASYRSLLTTAGADSSILNSLASGKIADTEPAPQPEDQ